MPTNTSVYPCPQHLHTLVENLSEADDKLYLTFYPNDSGFVDFAQTLHTLSYREMNDRLREYGVHPYILQWGDADFLGWGSHPECKIVSIYDKVGPEAVHRWKKDLLSIRPQDLPLEFLPFAGFFTDKRFVCLEFQNIPGKYIPYFQRVVPHIIEAGYTLSELSVQLHAYRGENYSDLHEYQGSMRTLSNGNIFFEVTIPLSRLKQFIEVP